MLLVTAYRGVWQQLYVASVDTQQQGVMRCHHISMDYASGCTAYYQSTIIVIMAAYLDSSQLTTVVTVTVTVISISFHRKPSKLGFSHVGL